MHKSEKEKVNMLEENNNDVKEQESRYDEKR